MLQADIGEQWVHGDEAGERGKAHLHEHDAVHDLSAPPFRLGGLEMLSMKVCERLVLSVVDGDALLPDDEDEKSEREREAEKYGCCRVPISRRSLLQASGDERRRNA